jgi:C_GCAxxG_C_C family probable redox protein
MASISAEQAKAEALARFQAPAPEHINCGQAVLCYALLRLDEDPEAITQARYFGGGITGMGEICGVLNGAALALGVRDLALADRGIDAPQATADQLKAILRDFAEEFGSRRCRELTGYDLSDPEGMATFKASDIRSRCTDYVVWAIDRLEPLLESAVAAA